MPLSVQKTHFTKTFGDLRARSERNLLPRDGVRTKVTTFTAEAGTFFEGVRYDCDETVHVQQGALQLRLTGTKDWRYVSKGETYFCSAGVAYDVKVTGDAVLICFFSQAEDGTLPVDEEPSPTDILPDEG